MPQQCNFLAEAAPRHPAGVSQRKQYAAFHNRAPPSRPASSAQKLLFAFQAGGHEVLMLPNKTVTLSPPPVIPPTLPAAVASADDVQHVGSAAQGDKARDLLTAIRTLKAIAAARRPATPDTRRTLAGCSCRPSLCVGTS